MIRFNSPARALLTGSCGAAALALSITALSIVPSASLKAQEVVQALPDPAEESLNEALRRLSRNPESVPALVAAGRAALDLGDDDAALGFFNRAQALAPEDGRVLVGLAQIAVRRGEAVTALQLFRNAEAAGEPIGVHAAARGLAYDLVGRNDRAQRLYRLALSQEDSAEVRRRLALSYAISGDVEASEDTLLPLLQRQDRAAYRTRAFALAIRGRADEATTIAEAMLPQRLSQRLAPYFRYMPRLTRAQQAAAANLGRFPAASEVGRDDTRIAAYSEDDRATAPTRTESAADRLEPRGEPLGPAVAAPAAQPGDTQRQAVEEAIAAAPEPAGELPALSEAMGEEPVVVATLDTPAQTSGANAPAPSFSLTDTLGEDAAAAPAQDRAVLPDPSTSEASQPVQFDLAEAFAEFVDDATPAPTISGAVDITTIEPPRERPEPETPEPPPPPAHPARHWVQLGIGQDTSAFRFDWRRLVRNADGLLDDAQAFTAPWGQTNRLLTGPYETTREAQQMVSDLAEAGVDSFRFSSEEGQEIQSLD